MNSIKITLPFGMALRDWADQIALDLDSYGAFGRLQDETKWQDWAMQFVNNASLKENIPIPYNFSDWQTWADRFCQTVE
jgi:hypothetical protein